MSRSNILKVCLMVCNTKSYFTIYEGGYTYIMYDGFLWCVDDNRDSLESLMIINVLDCQYDLG